LYDIIAIMIVTPKIAMIPTADNRNHSHTRLQSTPFDISGLRWLMYGLTVFDGEFFIIPNSYLFFVVLLFVVIIFL
jgi:hypothetical protein